MAAVPLGFRSREQLEWVAEQVQQAGGSSLLWTAVLATSEQARVLAEQVRQARAVEYAAVRDAAGAANAAQGAAPGDERVVLRRLRAELRRIERPGLVSTAGTGRRARRGAGAGRARRGESVEERRGSGRPGARRSGFGWHATRCRVWCAKRVLPALRRQESDGEAQWTGADVVAVTWSADGSEDGRIDGRVT